MKGTASVGCQVLMIEACMCAAEFMIIALHKNENFKKNELRSEVISHIRVLPIKNYIGRKECVGGMTSSRYVLE